MGVVDLPLPAVWVHGVAGIDVAPLEHDLVARVDTQVRFDIGSRAAYSTDASNAALAAVLGEAIVTAGAVVRAVRR
jgi:uncharacterized membrane protein